MNANVEKYILSGGVEGKKRLNVLSEVLYPYTTALLERDGPIKGFRFLDLGCGGGNVSLMAAEMVGEKGHVTAIDFDGEIISLAMRDAEAAGIKNISYHAGSAYHIAFEQEFDIAYARFLLSHLENPLDVLKKMLRSLKAGGKLVIEDVHFSGHFCHPQAKAFSQYLDYYALAAKANGHNPEIGPSLMALFRRAGVSDIQFDVIQPCFSSGPGKWMAYLTLDKISHTLLRHGIADEITISKVLQDLQAFTEDETTLMSLPRIFRVWGRKD